MLTTLILQDKYKIQMIAVPKSNYFKRLYTSNFMFILRVDI